MFLKNNFNVIITGRNKNNVEKITTNLNLNNKNNNNSIVKGYKLDYTDIINSKEFINLLENKKIKPSYLVNNAGTLQLDSIHDITLNKMDLLFKINILGPMLLSKFCIDIIRNTNENGAILFNTPPYNIHNKTTYLLPYMQSKLAQTTLMKSLANSNVNNNAIVCGFWTNYPLMTDAIIERKICTKDNCMHPSILSKTLEEILFNSKNKQVYNSKVVIDEDILNQRNISLDKYKLGNNIKKLDDLFFYHLKNKYKNKKTFI